MYNYHIDLKTASVAARSFKKGFEIILDSDRVVSIDKLERWGT